MFSNIQKENNNKYRGRVSVILYSMEARKGEKMATFL